MFAFNGGDGTPLALILPVALAHSHLEKKMQPQKSQKQPGQVTFLSGEMVPVSGIWRPDHSRCPNSGDIWLRKQTPFPPCLGCDAPVHFALIEEVLHISEDPDFQ